MRITSGCNHPTSALPWRSLLPHLLALLLLRPGSAQLGMVAPRPRVTAIVGQDVVLRCHLSPCKDARSSDIRWIQDRTFEVVYHYQEGVDLEQMEEYKGRTELLRNGLPDGNLDLRITAVSSSDGGTYICAVQDGADYAEAVVNLDVSDPFSPIIHSWKVALAVVLTLLLGSFVIIVFLHRKGAAQSRELRRKDEELAEQSAISERRDAKLVKEAAKLVVEIEELEKGNSQLKKHYDKMDFSAADLKKQVADVEERIETMENENSALRICYGTINTLFTNLNRLTSKLVLETEELEKGNSQLKRQFENLGLSASDLKKQAAELGEQAKESEKKNSKMKRQFEKLVEQTEAVENQNSLLKEHCEEMDKPSAE
ncbi:myosin heavy chain, fast skeletal muscle-like isoform X2 [Numida meleagris]|uniref:myosin heavy chain, fast skeletal muscle-like isoform X2 n=1 Tax=Numida meleagris TaxID=8996 RepID=UPI000B3E3501|nr:myosin heavy chain, fast skeletal muscle-like isoform X2 [Numida meleagris]